MKELIQHAKAGCVNVRAETDDPRMIQEDERLDNEVIMQAQALLSWAAIFKNVSNKHWVTAQVLDPVIKHVRNWMGWPKENTISLSDFLVSKVSDAD